MEPVHVLRVFFLCASATVLLVNSIPAFRSRFLAYGSRTTGTHAPSGSSPIGRLLDYLSTIQVPHGYFTHFYIVSVVSSLFWALQILANGSGFQWLAQHSNHREDRGSMSVDQVILTWLFMLAQGGRRLWESYAFAKPSSSKMFFIHWLLGLSFYLAMGLAVWIEGIPSLITDEFSPKLLILPVPSLRTMVGVPLFLLASGAQHDAHGYLASLQKYQVPSHPLFNFLLCPHYTAECLIYVSLAIVAAPSGYLLNRTLVAALIFVVINLGATAETTREWYEAKFGAEKVHGRWRMIPGVY